MQDDVDVFQHEVGTFSQAAARQEMQMESPQPSLTVAALQLCCTPDRASNLARATALAEQAVSRGAQLVLTPENTDAIAPQKERLAQAESLDGPFIRAWQQTARRLQVEILVGSFGERREGDSRVHNTSVLIDRTGQIAAIYRKIHLFDADPPDGVPYRESDAVAPGEAVVSAPLPFGRLGLSICYDVRFPELYRRHADADCALLAVPAAFTVPTGRAHWELLLRARAVENLAFVIAPAQVGEHFAGRRSYGHALVVSPWGEVLADAGEDAEGMALATLTRTQLDDARRMLPALGHRRLR